MKSYKYSTKERAERVSKTLGCSGSHYHNENGTRKYMPCKSHEIFLSKTKNKKEEEVTELIDADGTWLTSDVPILDPASTVQGSTTTDKTVQQARNPRDPLLRGWYGYYGEGVVREEDMSDAFGYEDTKDMDYKDTVEYYQKELGLEKDKAVERAVQQGKKPSLEKRAPKKIKDKKNFIDRLILKEKGLDEDVFVDKDEDNELKPNLDKRDINPLLLRNIRQLKKFAKENGVSVKELIKLLKNE